MKIDNVKFYWMSENVGDNGEEFWHLRRKSERCLEMGG